MSVELYDINEIAGPVYGPLGNGTPEPHCSYHYPMPPELVQLFERIIDAPDGALIPPYRWLLK